MAQRLVNYITKEDYEKIFSKIEDKEIKLACLLGFEAGMRISEIVGLRALGSRCCNVIIKKEKSIRLSDNKKITKYLCSKCNKELLVKDMWRSQNFGWEIEPLQRNQVEDAMIRILGGKGGKDRVTARPKRMNETALKMLPLKVSRRTIQREITRLGKVLLNKEISFHTLRHGFGSHLAGQGRPLHEIQMLMGHSRLDTTGIYLHANPKQAVDGAREVF